MSDPSVNKAEQIKIKENKEIKEESENRKTKEITHVDFINFLEPFFEPIDEIKYQKLRTEENKENIQINSYTRYADVLRDRLCASFVVDESVDLENVPEYSKELKPKSRIRLRSNAVKFFRKHSVLEEYKNPGMEQLVNECKAITAENNRRRAILAEGIAARMEPVGYFQVQELINKELEGIQRKRKQRKKNKTCLIEEGIIREYISRAEEFDRVFGKPNQFADDVQNYEDLLSADKPLNYVPFLP